MKRLLGGIGLLIAVTAVLPAASGTRPNIVFILCDDLGFGATGPTWQNARAARADRAQPWFATPALDRLAAEGLQLRRHYSGAPICAPARASFLRGVTQGHAGVRDNQFDKALENNHTIATVLHHAGYATAAIGKWGLQGGRSAGDEENEAGAPGPRETPADWPGYPLKRGFDFYFGYVRHQDGHFHYPKEDHREVWENDREVSGGFDLCYTADLFTARAKRWIVEQHAQQPDQPFFLYLALDTPHAVMAYPPCAYPAGGGLHGGVQWTGQAGAMLNTAVGRKDGWCDPAVADATWDHDHNPATPEVPWPDVQKRFSTSVRRIDAAVGDLLQLLGDLGLAENTLVVFTSDNGPTPESYLKGHPCDPGFFGTTGPFSGLKRDTLEGGIRVPAFVRWPGHVSAGRTDDTPSGQWDWLATFAELAGLAPPAASDGVSLVPTLTGRGAQPASAGYFEYFHPRKVPAFPQFAPAHRGRARQQMQTVTAGRYVGVRYDIRGAHDAFEIYDLAADPNEAENLAGRPGMEAVQAELQARALQARRPDVGAPRPYDGAAIPAISPGALESGRLRCETFAGQWDWVPEFRTLTPNTRSSVPRIDAASVPPAGGGLAFTGYFHAEREGDYTFHETSDGGAVLFVHEARVIDDDFARRGVECSGTIRLAAGWHPLRIYSRHSGPDARLAVDYEEGGGGRHPLTGAVIAVDSSSTP